MDSIVKLAIERMKHYMQAEELDKQEAIETACEELEENDLLGDYNYLELIEVVKGEVGC